MGATALLRTGRPINARWLKNFKCPQNFSVFNFALSVGCPLSVRDCTTLQADVACQSETTIFAWPVL